MLLTISMSIIKILNEDHSLDDGQGRKVRTGRPIRATVADTDWLYHLSRVCDGYLPTNTQLGDLGGNADCTLSSSNLKLNNKPISRRALAQAVRQLNIVGPISRVLAGSQLPEDAVSCFDFFRFRVGTLAGAGIPGSVDSNHGFWGSTLLQTAHAESAVWNAVAALGALQRRWEVVSCTPIAPLSAGDCNGGGGVVTGLDLVISVQLADLASSCYIKALSLASSIRDSRYMLALSIALAVVASLAGKWSDNQVHIRAGQSLVSQILVQANDKPVTELEINDAIECLAKLGLQWASFSEIRAPYPYADSLQAEWAIVKEDQAIRTIHQSLTVLLDISRRLLAKAGVKDSRHMSLEASGNPEGDLFNNVSMDEERDRILGDFVGWGQQTLQVLTTTTRRTQPAYTKLLILKLHHTFVHLLMVVGIARDNYNELSWDNCLGHFERIITLSVLILQSQIQTNPLTLSAVSLDEPGIIMPLWLTVSRCRHPILRRRALGLLRSARRQEGMWMSTSSAVVAEILVAVEEEGSPKVSMPILVSEFCSTELCTTLEMELAKLIAAEDYEPQSWLLGRGFGLARTNWEVPGMVLVPLRKRVTEVSIFCEPYDPRSMESCAEVTLMFAETDAAGELRNQSISVKF
ncbi:hypothetical protein VMCG_09811 [Cytospora schulzeri]|uniref:Transcription factor domain-containing protein n=1 Tax=Cytospora schulzeri TaxID=448051 RepID=A0A423VHH5_9PEZI|nr:hypothetical protein VMCG_09811 [Valsa malicola]